MSPALLGAFIGATAILMLIPGPNVALIVANSLAFGARAGLMTRLAGRPRPLRHRPVRPLAQPHDRRAAMVGAAVGLALARR